MSVTKNTGLAERGLNAAFKPAFKDAESLTSMIATLVNSDGASETYKWLGQNPTIREWKDRIATKALRDPTPGLAIIAPGRHGRGGSARAVAGPGLERSAGGDARDCGAARGTSERRTARPDRVLDAV